jgi:septum formation protein
VRLVLASRSPRRADLLTLAGYDFEIAPADIDERSLDGETPTEHVRRLGREKAAVVAPSYPGSIVLGADTVVVIDQVTLGKPFDDADAVDMLRRLSGRTHEVLTGVALHASSDQRCEVESTRVTFRELTAEDIAWYVESGEPEGKAGAYAIQGLASRFVIRIEGSYANVVGLPVALVDRLLREFEQHGS